MKSKIRLLLTFLCILGLAAIGAAAAPLLVKEQVKCVFADSDAVQQCTTDDKQFACSGIGTCVADVSGEQGRKLTWKSTCGGYAYTIIDGNNKYAEFTCTEVFRPVTTQPPANSKPISIKEQVKCVFANSDAVQKCYSDEDAWFGCSGIGTCVVDVAGDQNGKIMWKSSCGGSAYTVIDGNNEYAEFVCEQTPEPNPIVKEQVKCVFANSESGQKCYSDDGRFGCSGTGTCIADVSGEKGRKQVWKSSCGGYAYTVIDGEYEYAEFTCTEISQPVNTQPSADSKQISIKEQVKCIFANSDGLQKCYADDGQLGCSGVGTCVVDVSGEKGRKMVWKSSCGGYDFTVIDGNNKYAEFKCGDKHVQAQTAVKEQVRCIFVNSDSEQKCYTTDGNEGCSGVGICHRSVFGEVGKKLIWKSSCGGYGYTIFDGNDEAIEFVCVTGAEVTEEVISGKGFRFAYWQCYDGKEQKQGGETSTSCKSSETWQSYAQAFCKGHCYDDGSKCGVNSYSVSEECYLDFEKEDVTFVPSVVEEETKEKRSEKYKKDILICKDSCPLNGKCYPFGYRTEGMFCSDTGSFAEQRDKMCENNFECRSNVCVDGKCVSSGLIQKIIKWFKSFYFW